MIFKNRREAGRLLGKELSEGLFKNGYDAGRTVVIGLLRGGVPVAYEVAAALKAPLDVAIVRKIGAPNREELAIGAIVDGKTPKIYLNRALLSNIGVSDEYIDKIKRIKLREIREKEKFYRSERKRIDVYGKIVIVVDDGIATGASIAVVAGALREEKPEKIIIAVPVASAYTLKELKGTADDIVVLSAPEEFYAVGEFYSDFSQTDDSEVITLLKKAGLNRVASD